jgi:hypothetical protein
MQPFKKLSVLMNGAQNMARDTKRCPRSLLERNLNPAARAAGLASESKKDHIP